MSLTRVRPAAPDLTLKAVYCSVACSYPEPQPAEGLLWVQGPVDRLPSPSLVSADPGWSHVPLGQGPFLLSRWLEESCLTCPLLQDLQLVNEQESADRMSANPLSLLPTSAPSLYHILLEQVPRSARVWIPRLASHELQGLGGVREVEFPRSFREPCSKSLHLHLFLSLS